MDVRLLGRDQTHVATSYRQHYSELARISMQAMQIYTVQPSNRWLYANKVPTNEGRQCCYKIGFVHLDFLNS